MTGKPPSRPVFVWIIAALLLLLAVGALGGGAGMIASPGGVV